MKKIAVCPAVKKKISGVIIRRNIIKIRKIIEINEEKCNGCGLCAKACHENAIGMVNGKAKLLRDDYCDGLGDCLPTCPTGAITFVEREAAAYDEAAVEANKRKKNRQWPIQIQLTPVNAPYFDGADLLIAADCTAFAYANFAKEIQKGKITLIGCPNWIRLITVRNLRQSWNRMM